MQNLVAFRARATPPQAPALVSHRAARLADAPAVRFGGIESVCGHYDPMVALRDAVFAADTAGTLERRPIDARRTTA